MRRLAGVTLMVGLVFALSLAGMSEVSFKKHVINAKSVCESAGVLDVNRDGVLDVLSGEYWYEGPGWKRHFVRKIEVKDTYMDDFATVPLDVNGDGWTDVVSVTWFSKRVSWIENPAGKDVAWTEHVVDNPGNCETAIACDVNGDGKLDVLPNVMGKTVWYEAAGKGKKGTLTKHIVDAARGAHGLGFGDVNADGRGDIVVPFGWYEAPSDRRGAKWVLHAEFDLGTASIPVQVHDFNGDGLPDIFWGMGHNYGVQWLQQGKSPEGS